jgi:arylsulfatase A-like enzyme
MKLLPVLALILQSTCCLLAEKKPNIILIMADDVSWECFSCYGAEDYKTPHLDALAKNGIRFQHCYSTPICTTSRVKLMTGKYNFRNYTHFGYLNPEEKTFAQLLKSAGYKTAIAGKWQLNGLSHNAPGNQDATRPLKAGFDEYCLWQLTQPKSKGERFWSPVLEQNGKILTKKDTHNQFGPDIMSDFLCDFMKRHKDEPYFVYYPAVLVHDPFVPTPARTTPTSSPKTKPPRRPTLSPWCNTSTNLSARSSSRSTTSVNLRTPSSSSLPTTEPMSPSPLVGTGRTSKEGRGARPTWAPTSLSLLPGKATARRVGFQMTLSTSPISIPPSRKRLASNWEKKTLSME